MLLIDAELAVDQALYALAQLLDTRVRRAEQVAVEYVGQVELVPAVQIGGLDLTGRVRVQQLNGGVLVDEGGLCGRDLKGERRVAARRRRLLLLLVVVVVVESLLGARGRRARGEYGAGRGRGRRTSAAATTTTTDTGRAGAACGRVEEERLDEESDAVGDKREYLLGMLLHVVVEEEELDERRLDAYLVEDLDGERLLPQRPVHLEELDEQREEDLALGDEQLEVALDEHEDDADEARHDAERLLVDGECVGRGLLLLTGGRRRRRRADERRVRAELELGARREELDEERTDALFEQEGHLRILPFDQQERVQVSVANEFVYFWTTRTAKKMSW